MGTRPEAIKLAPVIKALERSRRLQPVVISTGQHREMLDQIVETFDLQIEHDLEVMQQNQDLAGLTARLIVGASSLLQTLSPDFVLVQGDTTSVWCAGLAAFYHGIPIGHVEAGLRTGDRYAPFPEEINRRLVTPLAELHFAATEGARRNLLAEGIADSNIEVTGNPVIDALEIECARQAQPCAERREQHALAAQLGHDWDTRPMILVTAHRRESFGPGLAAICQALAELADRFADHLIVYPLHLNPNVQQPVRASLEGHSNIKLIAPQGYSAFVALLRHCRIVLTDSGGLQEEAPALGKPVLVMREKTERQEGIAAGTAALVGTETERIVAMASHLLCDEAAYQRMARAVNPYGDGKAAERIVAGVDRFLRPGGDDRGVTPTARPTVREGYAAKS